MSKRNISFTKPPEPDFIKKMKDAIGYQEPATVETKREMPSFDENMEEREDEKPVVVVLKPGDLTEEELKDLELMRGKKIKFSKPTKKDNEEKNSLDFTSKKKEELSKKIDAAKEKTKRVKNSSLLSFDEDEDY
ncbi:uncharacterized protein KIAA1143 homolog [Uloborus diversus]|uniref:uncharacterized protein KIAA1143 homolog n=1 Tax=Uloborus diversus TaxID=327109 RepID=UPI00240916B1|nr:uncharacterized protein KIAA1143 homolog [Uloborus diversus]